MRAADLRIDVHLEPDASARALRTDVRAGLTATPKSLPPKWFYDERGSQLFDEITRLPEYYPTRRETEILEARSSSIIEAAGADTLIELGSGTSEKTMLLLAAGVSVGRLERFVPFDVSEATLRHAAERIDERFPGLAVHAVVGDFDQHLDRLPGGGRRMVAFLGGTIGNLDEDQRAAFLATLASTLGPGEHLLLGTDLVKPVDRLVAAYDDAAGVTAEFNRNVLEVVNRELGADFEVERFAHRAVWNAEHDRIEMWLDAEADMTVTIAELGLTVGFERNEGMLTELSCKFTLDRVADELAGAGFEVAESWTDDAGDFALTLGRRT